MINLERKIKLPLNVTTIINNLYDNNFEAFAVGGCIRDSLMGRIPSDWDITTNANPMNVKVIFENQGFKVIETGVKHGTVTVLIHKEPYEITTYRIDGDYLDNRRPSEVIFTNDLKEDLLRRDFTINAMAYNDKVGLVDFYRGLEHLEAKILCTVGNPEDRFTEDALRMLRAIRFSSTLKFSIPRDVEEAIKNNYSLLKSISAERIRDEFIKIVVSPLPSYGIEKLCKLKLMNYIIPEILTLREFNQNNKDGNNYIYSHSMNVLDNVENFLALRLSALLLNIGKLETLIDDKSTSEHFQGYNLVSERISREVLIKLKFDNLTINRVSLLVKEYMLPQNLNSKKEIKNFIIKIGEENLKYFFNLVFADIKCTTNNDFHYKNIRKVEDICYEILENREPLYVRDLLISGNDLIDLGLPKSKLIGETLNYLLLEVLQNPDLNKKEILLELAKKHCKVKENNL
ncbi:polynucleotide adenylyltransferase [Clostridium sp.]|uniref:CCA tRNA nucleotidyltransferase n=1 Tax=Clostridium sp. TaxID=1506 RepID=UPI002FC784F4